MASEAAVILGCSEWASTLDLWMEKRGLETRTVDSEWLEWGRLLEPALAQGYTDRTGRAVNDPGDWTIYVHPDYEWWGATPDRFVFNEDRGTWGVLELKNVSAWMYKEWLGEEIPLPYLVQIQHQMAATGLQWGSIGALVGGNKFIWRDIERDDDFLDRIKNSLVAFWGMVRIGNPPPPDDSEHYAAALQRLHGTDDGKTVKLSDEVQDAHEELQAAKLEIKALEKRKLRCENIIKSAIGPHTMGILPNQDYYTYKLIETSGYEVQPRKSRQLRQHKRKKGDST